MAKTYTLIVAGESVIVDEPVFGTIDDMLDVLESFPENRTRKIMTDASVKILALMTGKTVEEVRASHVSFKELSDIMARALEFCGMEQSDPSSGEVTTIAA